MSRSQEPVYFSKVKHNLKQEVVLAEALIGQPTVIPGQHHQCDRLQVPTVARARLIILSHGFLHPAEREPHSQKSRRTKEAFSCSGLTNFLPKQPHLPCWMWTWLHEHLSQEINGWSQFACLIWNCPSPLKAKVFFFLTKYLVHLWGVLSQEVLQPLYQVHIKNTAQGWAERAKLGSHYIYIYLLFCLFNIYLCKN